MKRRTFILSLLMIPGFIVTSCEKVVEIPLNAANTQLVVEAVVRDQMGDNYVVLSQTIETYSADPFPKISGATVTITDMYNNSFTLVESDTAPGRYSCPTLQATANNFYSLEVIVNGKVITAVSTTFTEPVIDSLSVIPVDDLVAQFLGFNAYQIAYNSLDPVNETNYYEAFIFVNGVPSQFSYYGDDQMINGQYYQAPFLGDLAVDGDSVRVIMVSVDEPYYRYIYSLDNANSSSPFSGAPSNPVSNIVGEDALGFFGVFMCDTVEVVIE